MLTGGLILGIMVLPIITAVSRDVLRAVPSTQIEGTLALGRDVVAKLPRNAAVTAAAAVRRGLVMLGLARAAGETMAVTMVIGNVNQSVRRRWRRRRRCRVCWRMNSPKPMRGLHRSALLEVALILLVSR